VPLLLPRLSSRFRVVFGLLVCGAVGFAILSAKIAQCDDAVAVSSASPGSLLIGKDGKVNVPEYSPTIPAASKEGEQAISTFLVPQGLKVELFAAEPMLANPVSFCLDEKGRVYVAESFRQSKGVEDNRGHMVWLDDDLAATTNDERFAYYKKHLGDKVANYTKEHDRIRLLEDRAGVGKADASTIFADGYNGPLDGTGAGVLARHGEIFYTCIPDLWRLRDTKNTGVANEQERLHTGFGVHVAFRGHDMHGLTMGPDGKLYFSIGDRGYNVPNSSHDIVNLESGGVLRCNLDGSELEEFARGLRNPQELAFDDFGNLFTCDNNSDSGDKARWTQIVEGGDYGWRFAYQYLADRGPWNREKLWHPAFAGQAAYIVPPVANVADGPSGLTYYPGAGLPAEYKDTFFLVDFHGTPSVSGVHSVKVKPKGAGFELESDEKFMWGILGTDVDFGPDGAMYVSDWVESWDGVGKGRIYRLFDPTLIKSPAVKEVQTLLGGDWKKVSTEQLVKYLSHDDRRIRQEAQFELADRRAGKELSEVAMKGTTQLARVHALWALGQTGVQWNNSDAYLSLIKLFDDSDPEIRAQAAKVLGGFYSLDIVDKHLVRLLGDISPRVRFYAAQACANRKTPGAFDAIVKLVQENDDKDPVLRHAGARAMAACGTPSDIEKLASSPSRALRIAAVVALRRLKDPAVASFLNDKDLLVACEAARAIHDAPIPEAMPKLAEMLSSKSQLWQTISDALKSETEGAGLADATVRRALAANYRVGGPECAKQIAEFAAVNPKSADGDSIRGKAVSQLDDALQVEAVTMLGSWAKPAGRDRVLNLWRPIEPRDAAVASDAMKPVLNSVFAGSNEVRRTAAQVAGTLGIVEAAPTLVKIVEDASREPALRVEALRMLDTLGEKKIWEITDAALKDKDPQVRVEALKLFVKQRPGRGLEVLKNVLANGTAAERQTAVTLLAGMQFADAGVALEGAMDQLIAGKLPAEVKLDLLEAAEARGTSKLKDQLAKYTASFDKGDPLADYRAAIAGGDAEAGKKLFRESTALSCRRCHKIGGDGGEVGPNLSDVAKRLAVQFKDTSGSDVDNRVREYLLESIVTPNKVIAKGFETVVVITDDGLQKAGIVKSEDDKILRLVTPEAKIIEVPKASIESRSIGPSGMPSDIIKQASKRQLRDLVEYLSGLKEDPAAAASVPEGHGQ
jgi:quinoprotein glucose dehydrogenase